MTWVVLGLDMPFQVDLYTSEKFHQWNDFVRTSKNGLFLFDRKYMDYHADRFKDHSLMIYDEKGKITAILPANLKDNILHSHQGLTFGGLIYGKKMRTPMMVDVMDSILNYCKNKKFDQLIYKAIPLFYHDQPAQEDLYALHQCGAVCIRTDVSSTIILKNTTYALSSGRKSGLTKAKDFNFDIRETIDFDRYFKILNDRLDEKYNSNATHSAEEMVLLANNFPKNINLYGCYLEDELVSGVIIYEYGDVAHTQYIASTDSGRETGAQDYLLNHLIFTTYKDFDYFDFGISTENQGKTLNTNLIDQKEGFGARATINQFYKIQF